MSVAAASDVHDTTSSMQARPEAMLVVALAVLVLTATVVSRGHRAAAA